MTRHLQPCQSRSGPHRRRTENRCGSRIRRNVQLPRHPERSKTGAGKCEEGNKRRDQPFRITERAAAEPQRFRKENSYEEGIYYGTGEGYLGDITTAVVIQDETIKAILVIESEDDEAFLKRKTDSKGRCEKPDTGS